jgi:hypothetical protein
MTETEQQVPQQQPARRARPSAGLRRYLAFGTGIGIEAGAADLRVTVAHVRPSGVHVAGAAVIENFRERPAAEWGATYAELMKRCGAGHLSATVLLPRGEVIVRQLSLPNVSDEDLAAAIEFQIDSLHPFGEGEAAYAWARTGKGGGVLVGMVRRDVLERYIALFTEAGIKMTAFTFSAAALYSGVRLLDAPPEAFITNLGESGEVYGESPARPVFSAVFDLPAGRALALAASELRLPAETEPADIATLLPAPKSAPQDYDFSFNALAYAAALAGACPRLALPLNLLPREQRVATSRLRLAPAAALAVLLAAALAAWASIKPIEDRKYMAALEREIAKYEPQARKLAGVDKSIASARARIRLLDSFRARTKEDLDALKELNGILASPAYLNSLEMSRDSIVINGYAPQAPQLLKQLDTSPLFEKSEFAGQLIPAGNGQVFRIRALREGASK